jgi:predicted O-methyltransferase YrrM
LNEARWTAVDEYVSGLLAPHDEALDAALAASEAAGLPAIQVSAAQGRLLQLLAQSNGSRRILEIGTLGGYSTIWLARALPPRGTLVTLEFDPKHAAVARANLERAGLADRVTIHVGAALDTLPKLAAAGAGPFDFAFVDADKENMAEYVDWAIRLAAPGALIVADNVVREGAVADASSTDPRVLGVRRMLAAVAADARVTATVVQTVGAKGYDGFALIRTAG